MLLLLLLLFVGQARARRIARWRSIIHALRRLQLLHQGQLHTGRIDCAAAAAAAGIPVRSLQAAVVPRTGGRTAEREAADRTAAVAGPGKASVQVLAVLPWL